MKKNLAYKELEVWQRAVDFAVEVIDTLETEAIEIASMLKGLINAINR